MNTIREEMNRKSLPIPALGIREKASWKGFYVLWPVILVLVLFTTVSYISLRYDAGDSKISIHGQRVSTEQMIRIDFEKWTADRLLLFEKSLQNLKVRADLIQGELRPDAQQRIERLKKMHARAQVAFSKLQNSDPAFWDLAKTDMTRILRDLKKAHSHVSAQITGLIF